MKLSAHMIVKNGVKFDYPFLEACESVLPICDELVVLEGYSDDETYDRLVALQRNAPKLKIIRERWDKEHFLVLSEMTNLAIEACVGKYHLQIQADEIIPEYYHNAIRQAAEHEEFDCTRDLAFLWQLWNRFQAKRLLRQLRSHGSQKYLSANSLLLRRHESWLS